MKKTVSILCALVLLTVALLGLAGSSDLSSALRADGSPVRDLSAAVRTKCHNSYHLSK